MPRPLLAALAISVMPALAAPVQADLMNEPYVLPLAKFAQARHYYDVLSDRACAGHGPSQQELLVAALANSETPTAKVAYAWLIATKSCHFYTGNEKDAFEFNKDAASSGYPVALSNTGIRLIRGLGCKRDTERGVAMTLAAIKGGYGPAAAHLSMITAEGTDLPQDLDAARKLLLIADGMDTDEALMTRAWGKYHEIMND